MRKYSFLVFAALLAMCFGLTACVNNKPTTSKEKEDVRNGINYLVLVNKQNRLPEDWEEKVQLSTDIDIDGDELKVEKEALENYYNLRSELLAEGIDIELDSCYRSVKEQEELWDRFTKEYGEDYVKKYVAVPGFSEHHTGLAIDICIIKDGNVIDDNDAMIEEREIFAKIHERLADYGFILRYLEGKDDITGYSYEPWHLRYVGSAKTAKEITEQGLTLEEYLMNTKE